MHKIHRYIGFLFAPLIIIVSLTGILLNHTDRLALDTKAVPENIVRLFYTEQYSSAEPITVNNKAFYRDSAGQIYVDGKHTSRCAGAMLAVLPVSEQIIAVCTSKILLFTADGILLEELGASLGIPLPFQAAAVVNNALLLVSGSSVWQLDPVTLQVYSLTDAQLEGMYKNSVLEQEQLFAPPQHRAADFTFERLLLDLHAGRVLGSWGGYLLDLTAVALLLMVVSGFCSWRKRKQSES